MFCTLCTFKYKGSIGNPPVLLKGKTTNEKVPGVLYKALIPRKTARAGGCTGPRNFRLNGLTLVVCQNLYSTLAEIRSSSATVLWYSALTAIGPV